MQTDYEIFSKYVGGKKKLSKRKFEHFKESVHKIKKDSFPLSLYGLSIFGIKTFDENNIPVPIFQIIAMMRLNMHIDQMMKVFPENKFRFILLSIWHMDDKKFVKMCREAGVLIDKKGNLFHPDPDYRQLMSDFNLDIHIALKKNSHKSPNRKADLVGFNGVPPKVLLHRAIEEIYEALLEYDETGLSIHLADEIADAAGFLLAVHNLIKR